jgi:putative transposase
MKLASSSYYYQPMTDLEAQDHQDIELRDHIERLQGEFPGYGYRRLGQQLRREGTVVNDKKIRRVQRKYQLFPIRWQSFKIADITYIRIRKGFVFLAAILDRYSRKVIGWAISKRIDAELCVAALKVALEQRQPTPGCIHHSDRGVQYACREYVTLLEQAQMQISMSRTANPYDNAHIESFFKTLKYEEVHLANYETYDDVRQRVPHFIEECITPNGCIQPWGIYPQTNTKGPFNQQQKLPLAPPSNLGENSPVEGAQSMFPQHSSTA